MGDDLYCTVQSSRGDVVDLSPPVSGNLLHWLNGHQHPDIVYVAVVRDAAYGLLGDQVAPAPSQDLCRVVAGDRQLSLQDGLLLSELVSRPANATATTSK